MESSGYVDQKDVRAGEGARLDAATVVLRGRWREFRRTVLIAVGLFLVQQPPRSVVDPPKGFDQRESVYDFGVLLPGRLSLVIDVLFVLAYVFVAYRAFGIVRSSRVPDWALRLNQAGLALVFAGAVLDLWEDVRLWELLDGRPHDLSVGFGEVFGAGDGGYGFTALMFCTVVVGLVVQAASFLGMRLREPGSLRRPALSNVRGPGSGGTVICCSGGGIRSAAFSLGGLQALTEAGIYQQARAVVGVSGGGYVGAAYHSVRWNPADSPDDTAQEWAALPADQPAFASSSPEMQWLRRHTRYVLNGIRVAAQGGLSLLFGIAVNLLLIAAVLMGTAWFLAWLMLASGRLHPWQSTSISGSFGDDWTFLGWVWVVPLAGIAVFLVEKIWDRAATMPWDVRNFLRITTGYLLFGGLALTALVLGVPALVAELGHFAATSSSPWAGLLHQLGFVPTAVCEEAVKTASACGVEKASSVSGTSPATVPGISVVTAVTSVLAVLASAKGASSDSGSAESWIGRVLSRLWAKIKDPIVPWAAATAVVVIAIAVLLRWVAVLVAKPSLTEQWEYVAWFAVLLLLTKVITDANRTSLHHFFRERISYAFLVRRKGGAVQPLPYKRALRFSEAAPPADRGPELVACAVANVSDEEVVPSRRGCIPFVFDHHQIGLTDRLLPEGAAQRVSATYEFAADARYRDATIPAAVAISAAAFSPLAGRENVRLGPYRAVLALGNARLGVWLPNPLWVDELGLVRRLVRLRRWEEAARIAAGLPATEFQRLSAGSRTALAEVVSLQRSITYAADEAERTAAEDALREKIRSLGSGSTPALLLELGRAVFKKPGVTRLAKEGFGKASVYDRFLYVTDGGHYDNLGLIEALRRKPAVIYVLDASNDKEDTFRTLGRAIATARMDLDCEVELDPRRMKRVSVDTRAAAAWCPGKYRFGDGTGGDILLAKAILLDGLPWDVEAYAGDNADFPRTSTGNQLYSEFDFEAYRELGVQTVRSMLAPPPPPDEEDAAED